MNHNNPGATRLSLLVLIGAAVLFAAPGQRETDRDSIQGQVRVRTGGNFPSHIMARVEVADHIVVAQQIVSSTGKFAFFGLKEEYYTVIVSADGFHPGTALVDMHYFASRFPTIYLTPLGAKKTPPPPGQSPTDLAVPKKARKEYEAGHAALEARDLESARQHLERAIEKDPCYARALTELGVVRAMQNDLPSAESDFQRSIHCDGVFLEAYVQMGILLDAEKKFSQSESILEEGLRVAPNDAQLHYRLGAAHHRLRKFQEAVDEYLKSESLSAAAGGAQTVLPAEIHVRLADAYLQLKAYDKARSEMQTYLQIAPAGPLAAQTRALLEKVDALRKSNTALPEGPP